MSRALPITLLLLLVAFTAGCRDPIVGRWAMKGAVGERAMIFHANGTAEFDRTRLEQALKQSEKNPLLRKEVQKSLDRVRGTKTTWERVGKLYEIRTQRPGMPVEAPGYAKLEGEQLHLCDASGTPTGITLTRSR